jgi:anti-sigma B factor antagonist
MPQEHFPVLWLGRTAVISLPVEIDITNAGQVREDLLSVLNREPGTLIVDMGGTTFCDSAGVNALVRARRLATASEADIRLVVAAPGVLRVLAITGVDHLMKIYPSVAVALETIEDPRQEAGAPGEESVAPGPEAVAPGLDEQEPGYPDPATDPEGWAAQPT